MTQPYLPLTNMEGIENKTNRHLNTGQQPGTKNAHGPVDQLPVNRVSNAGQTFVTCRFCSPIILNKLSLVRASRKMLKQLVCRVLENLREACFLGA